MLYCSPDAKVIETDVNAWRPHMDRLRGQDFPQIKAPSDDLRGIVIPGGGVVLPDKGEHHPEFS
jgi:hypothetical protein